MTVRPVDVAAPTLGSTVGWLSRNTAPPTPAGHVHHGTSPARLHSKSRNRPASAANVAMQSRLPDIETATASTGLPSARLSAPVIAACIGSRLAAISTNGIGHNDMV